MTEFVFFLFVCLLFRWGFLHRVLLLVGWCQVLYSGGFLCVSSHCFILPRVISLVDWALEVSAPTPKAQNLISDQERKFHKQFVRTFISKLLRSCLTLCDPIDGSPPGSTVPGILQARTLEWVAISFSNEGKWKAKVKLLSHVGLFEMPWTAAYQDPPSMGFFRQDIPSLLLWH